MDFFRGDDRLPGDLQPKGGFTTWYHTNDIPTHIGGLLHDSKDMATICTQITSRTYAYVIATTIDQGRMFDKKNRYTFTIPDTCLEFRNVTTVRRSDDKDFRGYDSMLAIQPEGTPPTQNSPFIYLVTGTFPNGDRVIALLDCRKQKGEASFFTPIPYQYINKIGD